MKIQISALLGIKMDVYVRFTDVNVTDKSFSITAATLYGHTDAGTVTFSGSFNPKTGVADFAVHNETTTNVGSDLIGYGRTAQTSQWKTILSNVKSTLGGETESETVHKEISIQNPQKGDAVKVVDENLQTNTSSETYIEKK